MILRLQASQKQELIKIVKNLMAENKSSYNLFANITDNYLDQIDQLKKTRLKPNIEIFITNVEAQKIEQLTEQLLVIFW